VVSEQLALSGYPILFNIHLTDTGLALAKYTFGVYWTMTSVNDIIRHGIKEIPEPTTKILFGTGLAGIASRALRRKRVK
jgi:hypothetical protein